MSEEFIPELLSRYPGVKYGLEGSSQDQAEFMDKIIMALVVALFLIPALYVMQEDFFVRMTKFKEWPLNRPVKVPAD